MTIWAWLMVSIPMGALVCMVLLNVLLKTPASRMWLNERLSWTNQTLPPHCHALVRHGKWVAKRGRFKKALRPTRIEPTPSGKSSIVPITPITPSFAAQTRKRP